MDPSEIVLENLTKNFEYERIAREIDSCENIDQVKNIAKSYVKLHLKYQETLAGLNFNSL
jgi:hypothetical protein